MKIRVYEKRYPFRRYMWLYANKNGGPVLKEESRWYKHVSGILLSGKGRTVIIMFRRGQHT